ncbi:MAG: hypothetical protein A2675_03955 [Candidatus Yonathbacteria bacterium RIFCSPHIGHO2_01_FULL_51_10]|uniref:Phosphatidic acid phosphatase type 2/haloperoxidase domain-containing protein n=1 Tax=Candidatus Yonathbacteria bacterium RIFCSPHIGHO2_01_FULL_51_10 TaxID=1802723 RepID=A0A1G2S5V5_9BACT|nr:MAG: hypothetical protein A2675_03955 [Candidatus Yonathbacteria bacterium RIFCSPHIGHO2_01_FULL_51_10]
MNETLFHALNSLAGVSPVTDAFIIFSAVWLPYVLVVVLGGFLLFHHDKPSQAARDLFVILAAASCAYLVARAIKGGFPMPRPFMVLQDVNLLFRPHDMQAFPSSHATFFMALASALFFYHRRIAWFFFVAAVLIGVARVVAGVHWPGDILAGWIIGGGIGALAYLALQKLQNRWKSL